MQRQCLGPNSYQTTKIKQTMNAEQIQPSQLQEAQRNLNNPNEKSQIQWVPSAAIS